jgi:hypothetical protein
MRGPFVRSWHCRLWLATLVAALASTACRQDATEPSLTGAPGPAVIASPSLSTALTAQGRYTEMLLAKPGIVGTGVGLTAAGKPAVKVFTRTPDVTGIPTSLDGVPVEVVVTGEITSLPAVRGAADFTVAVAPSDIYARPVPIGVSTGNEATCSSGTIGARVKAGNKIYALSNNHVYALENQAPLGSRILQPGRYDLNCATGGADKRLGSLTKFVPVVFSKTASNIVDAAIALTSTSMLDRGTPPDGYGIPAATPVAPAVGMPVQKYGKTSKLTVGWVDAINATVTVTYNTGTTRFVKQILIAARGPFCRAGDSGSLIVTTAGRQPVGLLFAGTSSGYTFANPIGDVLKAFNVSIDGT